MCPASSRVRGQCGISGSSLVFASVEYRLYELIGRSELVLFSEGSSLGGGQVGCIGVEVDEVDECTLESMIELAFGRGGTGRLRWSTGALGLKVGAADVSGAIVAGMVFWLVVKDPLDVEARDRGRLA